MTTTVEQETRRLRIPQLAGLSQALRSQADAFNATVEQAVVELANLEHQVDRHRDGSGRDPQQARAVIEQARAARESHQADLPKKWRQRCELLAAAVAEVEQAVDPARQNFDKVRQDVREDLEKIGQGLEATPSYTYNGAESERQLEGLVAHNVRTRAARQKLGQAVAAVVAAKELHKLSEQAAADAEQQLEKMTREALATA